ncbi:hypothetical protein OIU84_005808 [Salix udensis]|uniref:Uncharacterized protein n=1 Tax=Salix udensis TaxID=889485 RepID=A0AAD6P1D5_9ROSI|nr:hypothetical protein OIU84_005808 [Salix udensis]
MDSERATTKPRKCLEESELMNLRMSSGDWIFLDGGLEAVRKGNDGDFLGLRDWSEYYGLRIRMWWEIYCRRTDRAVTVDLWRILEAHGGGGCGCGCGCGCALGVLPFWRFFGEEEYWLRCGACWNQFN